MITWRRVSVLLLATSLNDVQAWAPSLFVSKMPVSSRQVARSTGLSMAAIPLVDEWKVDMFGRLTGVVTNHPEIDDGDIITTSALADPKSASARVVVQTKSGSKYKLGEPKNRPKANGMAVKSAAVKKPKQIQKPAPRPAPSMPVVGNKAPKDERALNAALRQAKIDYGLTGETVGDGKYLLSGRSKRSTSGKSNIWTAYRSDGNGLPVGEAVTIKVSPNSEALERESSNYQKVTTGLRRGMFVQYYEFFKVAGKSRLANQCALVIEKGDQDLKSFFYGRGSGLAGSALRDAAAAAAQCLQAVHASGLVWTDLKAENFVVAESSNGDLTFKGIDLESAMPVRDNPVDYSPEACPPEFAEAFLAGDGPYFVLDYSYDVWSFGMLLYEISTGQPYFAGKKPSQITKILRTEDYEFPVEDVPDETMKDLITKCLQTNPKRRPSVTQILLHPYFLSTGVGPFSFWGN